MNKMDEIIIVAPRNIVLKEEELVFQGTEQDPKKVLEIFESISNSCSTMRRGDAENDELYKQPITYAVIRKEDEIFVYERLSGAGETRLHNKLSLGVGGHMNPIEEDAPFDNVFLENLEREINEEILIESIEAPVLTLLGLINDDSNSVGKVHLGILAVLDLSEDSTVQVKETEELDGKFVSIAELREKATYDRLENWSKIVVDIL